MARLSRFVGDENDFVPVRAGARATPSGDAVSSEGADDEPCHKSLRGSASQFFVAGELCRRGWVAVVTLGNCPNTDILCSNLRGDRFVHVQVKTFQPGRRTCSVGRKAENEYGDSFFWVLAGIPSPSSGDAFTYYVIPAKDMALHVRASHAKWLSALGVNGQPHDPSNSIRVVALPPRKCRDGWDISQYAGKWDLIASRLR